MPTIEACKRAGRHQSSSETSLPCRMSVLTALCSYHGSHHEPQHHSTKAEPERPGIRTTLHPFSPIPPISCVAKVLWPIWGPRPVLQNIPLSTLAPGLHRCQERAPGPGVAKSRLLQHCPSSVALRVKVNTKDKIKSLSSAKNTSPRDETQRAPASTAATVAMETRLQTGRREGQRNRRRLERDREGLARGVREIEGQPGGLTGVGEARPPQLKGPERTPYGLGAGEWGVEEASPQAVSPSDKDL